jgi:ATP-dependent Clp protease ATP-binding subunit ClpC
MLWSDSLAVRSLIRTAFPGADDFALTDCAEAILSAARKHAARGHGQIAPEHVLLEMATFDERRVAHSVLERLGVDLPCGATEIVALLPSSETASPSEDQSFSPQAVRLLSEAQAEAYELGHTWIGSEHLVLGLLRCGSCAASEYLLARSVTAARIREETLRALVRETGRSRLAL